MKTAKVKPLAGKSPRTVDNDRLSEDMRRFSYAEWVDVFEGLEDIAAARRTNVSAVIRELTKDLVEKHRAGKK